MLRYILAALVVALAWACQQKEEPLGYEEELNPVVTEPQLQKDLSEILADDTLRVIMVYNSTGYFLYRGETMGYEYEMAGRLADYLDLKLKVILAEDINELISMVNRGEGDLIAFGLTITEERKKYISFTEYLYLTRQVLVQRKPAGWRRLKRHQIQKALISDPIELIGDTVAVRYQSSYYPRLLNLRREVGGPIHIDTVPGSYSTAKLIEMVAEGSLKYTVADDNLAKINASYYPQLDVKTAISFSQRVAWGIRQNAPLLRDTINHWLQRFKKDVDYYVIYNKYFENKRTFKKRLGSEFYTSASGVLSPYDSLLQLHAARINWDWRLLASLVYQESHFNPHAKSWAGAKGLMQLMPGTARDLGLRNRRDPAQNLEAGTRYLKQLWEKWTPITDSVERLQFTMASYNCGYQHVRDAQRLAEQLSQNPHSWAVVRNNLLKLSYAKYYQRPGIKYGYVKGSEPVSYVEQIFDRYEHYRRLTQASNN